MNDKELFWSLISPHLVDRGPKVTGRFNYSLDDSLSYWGDLARFVSRNHKFILPDNVMWVEDKATLKDNWQLPIDKYPNKMVLLKNNYDLPSQLWFDLPTVIIQVRLTPMHNYKSDYAIGGVEIYDKDKVREGDVGWPGGWPYRTPLPSFAGSVDPFIYGVWPPLPSFINWRIDPFEVKQ